MSIFISSKRMRFLLFLMVSCVLIFIYSCGEDEEFFEEVKSLQTESYSGDFLQEYIYLTCRITQTTDGFFPTQAARAYGYIGVAAYESIVHGIDADYSMVGQLQGFDIGSIPTPNPGQEYHWALACNAATAHIMRRMFEANISEQNLQRIDELERQNRRTLRKNTPEEVMLRSERYGRDVAQAVFEISKTDGAHEAYLRPFDPSYQIPDDAYCWVPTDANNPMPLSPEWMHTRSFLTGIVDASQPGDHLPFSFDQNSDFYKQAMDVYNQVNRNTSEEETIAKYWADDPFQTCTPAGHTFNITAQLLNESQATLEKTAVGLAMMSVAENDAFISCWRSKYDYILIRPVSYIQRYIDPSFRTVIGTPPFPAFTSGHSAEIGAAVKVLIHLFADENGNYTFTDLSQIQYGFEPRTFNNFYDLADECALSRFYGGIHFEMDNSLGLDLGFAVGDAVVNQIRWPQILR